MGREERWRIDTGVNRCATNGVNDEVTKEGVSVKRNDIKSIEVIRGVDDEVNGSEVNVGHGSSAQGMGCPKDKHQ